MDEEHGAWSRAKEMTREAIYQRFVSAREGPKELSQPSSKPSVRVRVVFLPAVDHILHGKRRALLGAAPAFRGQHSHDLADRHTEQLVKGGRPTTARGSLRSLL